MKILYTAMLLFMLSQVSFGQATNESNIPIMDVVYVHEDYSVSDSGKVSVKAVITVDLNADTLMAQATKIKYEVLQVDGNQLVDTQLYSLNSNTLMQDNIKLFEKSTDKITLSTPGLIKLDYYKFTIYFFDNQDNEIIKYTQSF